MPRHTYKSTIKKIKKASVEKHGIWHSILQFFTIIPVLFVCFSSLSLLAPKVDAAAGINKQINFQGKLTNADGTNVTDGSYSLIFSIYNVSSGGSATWTETDSVSTVNGIFQVSLGASTSLPGSVDFNSDTWYLGIKVSTETSEMTPRIRLAAVPYAFNSNQVNGVSFTGTNGTTYTLPTSADTLAGLATTQTFTKPNTFAPGSNAGVALTVTATTNATPSNAMNITQSQAGADGVDLTINHNSSTVTSGLGVIINGTGGTTTNAILISRSAGAVTNGLAFSGTIGTYINLGTIASGSTGISGTLANTTSANVTGISWTTGTITTSGTQNAESLTLTAIGAGTTNGMLITPPTTTTSGGTINAINIGAITTSNGTDTAETIGSGWKNVLSVNSTPILNGSGVLQSAGLSGTYSNNLTLNGTTLALGNASGTVSLTLGSDAIGDLYFRNSSGNVARLADVATGSCLTSGGVATAPGWGACSGGSVTLQQAYNNGQSIDFTGVSATAGLTIGTNAGSGNVLIQPNAGGAAALIVNKQGVNDIFTASASGSTQFVIQNSGNVGIGTNTTNSKLTLKLATNDDGITINQSTTLKQAYIQFQDQGAQKWVIGKQNNASDGFFIFDSANSRDALDIISGNVFLSPSGGSVALGTFSSPLTNTGLDIEKNGGGNSVLVVNQTGSGDILTASASGSTKFVIQNGGNVGIGTNNPSSPLTVSTSSTSNIFRLLGTSGIATNIQMDNTPGGQQTKFTFQDNGSDKWQFGKQSDNSFFMFSNASGNDFLDVDNGNNNNITLEKNRGSVQIGSTATFGNAALVVNQNNFSGNGDIFTASVSGTTKFTISNSGAVSGINATFSPAAGTAGLAVTQGNAPTVDVATITSSTGTTTANVNGLHITYAGGSAAVESAGERIDLTPGTTAGSTWSGLRVVTSAAAAAGTTQIGLKLENNNSDTLNGLDRAIDISGGGWDTAIAIQEGTFNTPYGGFGPSHNLLLWSEDFANAVWTTSGTVTTSANTTQAPNGEITADTVNFNGATTDTIQQASTTAAGSNTMTCSLWLKASSGTPTVNVGIKDQAGTPASSANTVVLSTNWRRYQITKTFSSATGNAVCYVDDNGSSSAFSVIAWGAQLEKLNASTDVTPGPYVATNTTILGSTRSIAASFDGATYIQVPAITGNSTTASIAPLTITGGAAGSTTTLGSTGGSAGSITETVGAGGASSGSGTGSNTGGVGGGITITLGNGGAASTATGGTNTGGAGGSYSLTAGNGGLASSNTTNNSGVGGSITLTAGNAGAAGNINGGTITINSGTANGTGTSTINIGSAAVTALNFGTTSVAKTITIGTNTAGTADTITIGNTQTGGAINIGQAQTGGTISIGGGSQARTGNIVIGSTGQTSGVTKLVGGTGTGSFGGSTSGIDIIPGTAGTINIGASGGAGTGAITIGQSTATQIINIANGVTAAGNTKTVNIGTAQNASTGVTAINIGLNNTSTGVNTVTIKAGGSGRSQGPSVTLGNVPTQSTAVCSSLANNTAPTAGTAYELEDCNVAPAVDYAESYPTDGTATYGDIMVLGPQMIEEYDTDGQGNILYNGPKRQVAKLVKATNPYASNVIGVISNNYDMFTSTGLGIVSQSDNPMPIALNGRIPVNITQSSAPIVAGDFITTSTEPGKGQKATQAGEVIGKALSSWTPNSGQTQVLVFVEQGYFNGFSTAGLSGDTQYAGLIGPESTNAIQVTTDKNIIINADNPVQAITFDKNGNGTFAGIVSAKEIKADKIDGLDERLASLAASLSTTDATQSSVLGISTSSAFTSLSVNGLATISGNLRVQSNGLFEGIVTVLDTLTAHNTIITGVSDFFANVVFHNNVSIAGKLHVGGDTSGTAIIAKGTTSVDVVFGSDYDTTPSVTTTLSLDNDTNVQNILNSNYTYIVTKRSTHGFTIILNKAAEDDLKFSWIALGSAAVPVTMITITPDQPSTPSATPTIVTPTP